MCMVLFEVGWTYLTGAGILVTYMDPRHQAAQFICLESWRIITLRSVKWQSHKT